MDAVCTTYTNQSDFHAALDLLGTFWADGAKGGNGYNPAGWYMANLSLYGIQSRVI